MLYTKLSCFTFVPSYFSDRAQRIWWGGEVKGKRGWKEYEGLCCRIPVCDWDDNAKEQVYWPPFKGS